MSKLRIYQVDTDVQGAVTRLAHALVENPAKWIIGLARRLPRIFDALLLGDPELKARLDQKLFYSSAVDFDPTLLQGETVALVDDCVQRGINLQSDYRKLHDVARQVLIFALARSRWHAKNGQYVGLRIEEPILELDPSDFGLVTSFLHTLLLDSSTPIDCDDRIVQLKCHSDAAVSRIISLIGSVCPLQALPSSPYSDISRYSQFIGIEHPLAAGLIPEPRISIDAELKIAWTVNRNGTIHFVPIILYCRPLTAETGVPGPAANRGFVAFENLFPNALDRSGALFEALHLWGSSVLAGRIWKALVKAGLDCSVDVATQEFQRSYGPQQGLVARNLYLANAGAEFKNFEPPSSPHEQQVKRLSPVRYHAIGSRIRELLANHYKLSNRGRDRLKWVPAGLGFSQLHRRLSENGISVSMSGLSAILDALLARCFVKSDTDVGENLCCSSYYCTELNGKLETDEDLVNFSLPEEALKVRTSKGLIDAFGQVLPQQRDSVELLLGHFLHGLVVALDLLGEARKHTMLLTKEQPHGRVVWCDTTISSVTGTGSMEENQHLFGVTIVKGRVSIRIEKNLLVGTPLQHRVLLLAREFGDALARINEVGLPAGDVLVFLSTCSRAPTLFNALAQNLRAARDLLASLDRNVLPDTNALRDLTQYMSGASDKLRLVTAAGTVATWLQQIASAVQTSDDFMNYARSIDENLPRNAWLGIFGQLVAEAHYFHRELRPDQTDLFAGGGQNRLGSRLGANVYRAYREWCECVNALGFTKESNYSLPYKPLIRRLKPLEKTVRLAFVKIDKARHGSPETDAEKTERREQHFPLFRSLAGFYHGFETRDPEGDALLFAFTRVRNSLRFAHAVAVAIYCYRTVNSFYRVAVAAGQAELEKDGNITSPDGVDLLPEIEGFLRTKEGDVGGSGVTVGSLVDDGLWGCLAEHLRREGMEVGEANWSGKRTLPGPIHFAAAAGHAFTDYSVANAP